MITNGFCDECHCRGTDTFLEAVLDLDLMIMIGKYKNFILQIEQMVKMENYFTHFCFRFSFYNKMQFRIRRATFWVTDETAC